MQGLKEQYMMRICGKGSTLVTPGEYLLHDGSAVDLGVCGMKLHEQLDQLCRITAKQVTDQLGVKSADRLLDDVNEIGKKVERDESNLMVCYSDYVIPGFISSSIMDNFHYFNSFNKEDHSDERFYNNHSAHTDSGLMTAVVVTDIPGLEVYDQSTNQWIALEQLLHEYLPTMGKKHRQFATIFWGDSVQYLENTPLKPTLHRVGKNHKERFSVVFKQRTSPLKTACRYQEDYDLALRQSKAIEEDAKRRGVNTAGWWHSADMIPIFVGFFAVAAAIGFFLLKRAK